MPNLSPVKNNFFPLFITLLGLNAVTICGAAFYTGSYVNDITSSKPRLQRLEETSARQEQELAVLKTKFESIQESLDEIKGMIKEHTSK